MFLNLYECPRCSTAWRDYWSATCEDECPSCGLAHVSPYDSEDGDEMDETDETEGAMDRVSMLRCNIPSE